MNALKTKWIAKTAFFLMILLQAGITHAQAPMSAQERLDILVGRAPKADTPAAAIQATGSTASLGVSSAEPLPAPPEETGVVAVEKQKEDELGGMMPTDRGQSYLPDRLEGLPKPKPVTLRDQAFKDLLDRISPLNPEQIVEMRKQQDRTQRAVATMPDAPPRPVSSTLTVDLSPGANPPVIRLGFGFVTSIVFVDSTGQSWPIADYNLGNPKYFNIQWDKKTNTLFMQSTTPHNNGNLAVRLATLNTPIMISLVSGQRDIDYRVDVQVPGRGPNALTQVVTDTLPSAPNPLLLSVLDGIPPPGSQELEVCGGCGRAWLYKGRLIFRSQLMLLSPAWIATVSSLDGTRVYELNPTPLLIASHNGQPVKIVLKGF